jgi:hypothetical protein
MRDGLIVLEAFTVVRGLGISAQLGLPAWVEVSGSGSCEKEMVSNDRHIKLFRSKLVTGSLMIQSHQVRRNLNRGR